MDLYSENHSPIPVMWVHRRPGPASQRLTYVPQAFRLPPSNASQTSLAAKCFTSLIRLGGTSTTGEFAEAIIRELEK